MVLSDEQHRKDCVKPEREVIMMSWCNVHTRGGCSRDVKNKSGDEDPVSGMQEMKKGLECG